MDEIWSAETAQLIGFAAAAISAVYLVYILLVGVAYLVKRSLK